jgi:hypothetical protein
VTALSPACAGIDVLWQVEDAGEASGWRTLENNEGGVALPFVLESGAACGAYSYQSGTLVLTQVCREASGTRVRALVTNAFGVAASPASTISVRALCCDAIDFNNDGLFPDDADLLALLTVLAGGDCPEAACNDIDFNNDGLFPDDSDLLTFLAVLAGGECE